MNTDSESAVHAADTHVQSHRYHDDIVQHRMHINVVFFIITVLCAMAYIGWAAMHVDYHYWYVAVPYVLAETICLGSLMIWSGLMLRRRDHPPSGLPLKGDPPPVDVIITCCGEPIEIIEKTLRAARIIDYPAYDVTVAADRDDPRVKTICDELGFQYLARPTHEGSKAGNLNYALERTHHPFVLTLDCDQVPHHTILTLLVGYFSVPYIGFVTTYQGFDVPKGDPWGNRDRVFYGSMQPARNDSNSAISCGSGVIYRRAALADIGGFSTWNLVEDLYSSLLLHNAGWKSVYHPFPLTHGTAPADVVGQVKQRWQWAVDSMRILIWRNPLFTRGLSWRQRLNYLGFGYSYLVFGIAFPIFYILPIWGLLSGKFMMNVEVVEFVIWRSPYLVAYILLNRFITEHRHNSKTFRAQAGLFMVFISAIITALFSKNRVPRYSVTHKSIEHPPLRLRLFHVTAHLVVIALGIFGIVHGFEQIRQLELLYVVNAVWTLWVIWLLLPFTVQALKNPPELIRH